MRRTNAPEATTRPSIATAATASWRKRRGETGSRRRRRRLIAATRRARPPPDRSGTAGGPQRRRSPRAPPACRRSVTSKPRPSAGRTRAPRVRPARRSRRAGRRTPGCVDPRPSARPRRRLEGAGQRGSDSASSAMCPPSAPPSRGRGPGARSRDVGDGIRRERPQRVGGVPVELGHDGNRGVERAVGRAAVAHGLQDEPGPERLREEHDVARPGAALQPDAPGAPCRRLRGRTSARRRGSCDRPPGSRPRRVASALLPAPRPAPRSEAPPGTPSREREQRPPPIANTSLRAFVAAMQPNIRGSSTTGGKKSTVKTSAVWSSSRYTAASSAGSSPTRRSAASAGTIPPSSSSSRAAELGRAPARLGKARQRRLHHTASVERGGGDGTARSYSRAAGEELPFPSPCSAEAAGRQAASVFPGRGV